MATRSSTDQPRQSQRLTTDDLFHVVRVVSDAADNLARDDAAKLRLLELGERRKKLTLRAYSLWSKRRLQLTAKVARELGVTAGDELERHVKRQLLSLYKYAADHY